MFFAPPAKAKLTLVGLLLVLSWSTILTGQESGNTSVADMFFLDLGIVIEPVTGKEQYSRLVESPSEEVKFRINKIKSGSVYMATSNEMLSTLDRINLRIAALEKSFHSEMERLTRENQELRYMLAEMSRPPAVTPPTKQPVQEKPKAADTQMLAAENTAPVKKVAEEPKAVVVAAEIAPTKPQFSQSDYMSAVFAYQREDYPTALEHFNRLVLDDVNPRIKANVMYWQADSYNRLGNIDKSLALLDKILAMGSTDRQDDALIQHGLLYRKLGQEEKALFAFQTLVQEHPTSEYVKLARMELKKAEMIP